MPTTYNSDIIAAGQAAKSGIYPQLTRFTATIPISTTLGTGDIIKLFKVAAIGRLYAAYIDISGALELTPGTIVVTFGDNLDTPNVHTAAAGIVNAEATNKTLQLIARNGGMGLLHLGGAAGKWSAIQYTADATLQLNVTTGGNGAVAAARTIAGWALTCND